MADDDDSTTTEETFTRKQVRAMIAAEVRKVSERYADYDDLKTRADAADGAKDKIDKVLEKLEAAENRAASAELENARRDVADELGLTPKQARRLSGKTREELLADGRELIDDLGIKPRAKQQDSAGKGAATETDEDETDGTDDDVEDVETEQEETPPPRQAPARRPARPRETLRSGAPRTPTQPDELDPAKLAALIPRR